MSVTLSPPLTITKQVAQERHWTVEEFYRAYETGELGYSKNWELIQGRIIEKMPPGFHHAALADMIAQMLRDVMQPLFIVREEKPVQLSADSQLIPDITVAHGARTDYLNHHPTPEEVVVLVEVADTTEVKDLGAKALQYAQAGITDYWVVLASDNAVVRHRQPSPEGYQEATRLAGEDVISPLVMPEAIWTVDALLGREEQL